MIYLDTSRYSKKNRDIIALGNVYIVTKLNRYEHSEKFDHRNLVFHGRNSAYKYVVFNAVYNFINTKFCFTVTGIRTHNDN